LMRALMGREGTQSPLPPPPDTFYNRILQEFIPEESTLVDTAPLRISLLEVQGISSLGGNIDRDYIDYICLHMAIWGIRYFTFDWLANWDDCFNQIISQFLLKVWRWGLLSNRLGIELKVEAQEMQDSDRKMMAILYSHFHYLRDLYKACLKDPGFLTMTREHNTKAVALKRVNCLIDMGVKEEYVGLFDNKYVASDDEEDFVENLTGVKIKVRFSKVPFWRSVKGTQFMDWIDAKKLADSQICVTGLRNRPKQGAQVTPQARRAPPVIDYKAPVPLGLPIDMYDGNFLQGLIFAKRQALKVDPPIFDGVNNLEDIIPKTDDDVVVYDRA
ncbi:hypothetical protein CROQUDRAFT_12656, partial [Cronartium quercuum f. sp. fusiforme G11]